ncbi:hypothetical protein WDW86_16295 [Bdellovibrionota bacterium FG-2]
MKFIGGTFILIYLALLSECFAASATQAQLPPLLQRLLTQESSLTERISDVQAGTQSLTVLSRGLPPECQKAEVWVSLVSQNISLNRTWVQILGAYPTALPKSCILALLTDVRQAEQAGMRVVASNLNRVDGGGHLYLEFSVEGPQADALHEKIRNEIRSGSQTGIWNEAMALMILSLLLFIWGFRLIGLMQGQEKRSGIHVN